MNGPIKYFRSLYPSDIQLYTMIFVFHMIRKTLLNQGRVMGDTTIDGSALLMFLCIILNVWIVFKNRMLLPYALRGMKQFLGYTIVCLLSFFWAIIPALGTVLSKGSEVLFSFLAVSLVLYKIDNKSYALYYVCVLTTLSALLGVSNSLKIGEMHTNAYTLVAGMGLLLALGLKRYSVTFKYINLLIVINAIALVVGTSSASYISFIFSFIIYISAKNNHFKIRNVIIVFALAYFLYPYIEKSLYQYVFYGHSEESIKGGTGRYEIWGYFIDEWKKSPWLGYGYIIGERSFALLTGTKAVVFSAHNGYLSVLMGTGIVGMTFFASFILTTIYKNIVYSKKLGHIEEYTILFPALVMLLLNNASYPALGSDWNYTFPPLIALLCLIHQLKYKNRFVK